MAKPTQKKLIEKITTNLAKIDGTRPGTKKARRQAIQAKKVADLRRFTRSAQ